MKRLSRLYLLVLAVAIFSTAILAQAAKDAQPGSEFDPLVTKSYVDEQIQKLSSKIGKTQPSSSGSSTNVSTVDEQVIDNLRTDVRDLTNLIIDAYTKIQTLEKQNYELIQKLEAIESGFVVVEASKGQQIALGAGSEAIVRSGEATAISGIYGGLADVTEARDLTSGQAITNQHLLISARDDGRGINVVSDVCFMLIRGSYSIE
ncbi:MAG: hypothetical protein GX283_07050 [Clostridiaceae bacterium]|jgi:septal ring factor EnvC (AmiA/AmiB activator)|nr:hypothetical protein [Clostridiaceae bacterium]